MLTSLLNVLVSSLIVGGAVFYETGSWEAGTTAAIGSLVNHVRSSPELVRAAIYKP
jgi:hypothetical protein